MNLRIVLSETDSGFRADALVPAFRPPPCLASGMGISFVFIHETCRLSREGWELERVEVSCGGRIGLDTCEADGTTAPRAKQRFQPRSAALFVFLTFALCALAAGMMPAHAERVEGRRAALVIGNSAYSALTPLPNAVKDAHRVSDVLARANFEVTIGNDLDKAGLERTIRDFLRSLDDGDVALFYYSGHAVQVAGENFVLPVDASLSSSYDLEVESYNISNLLDYMRQTSSLQILILDACRDNPFRSEYYYTGDKKVDVKGNKGLASLTPRQGSLIVYSTAPDQVAYDGAGELSPFTESLTDHILTPNKEVRQVLTDIRSDVIARTNGRQVPWDVSSLTSQFYFVTKQNLLVMGESLTEVRVSPQARRVELDIPPPVASGGMVLTASFDQAPKSGTLMLDDRKIEPGAPIDMERLHDVVYIAESEEPSVELIPYTVASADGHKVSGAVAIVFDPELPPPGEASGVPVAAQEPEKAPEAEAPVQLALATNVGTGFLTISDAMPRTEKLSQGWYRINERSPSAQVALGSRMLSEGDLVKSEEVAQLAIRPSLRIVDTDARVVLEPVGRSAAEAPVVINVNASVNRCDELAGDALDIQGVVDGVYPNDIRVEEALAACREAVAASPGVARFHHQLGRALYASGDYEAAIAEFETAHAAGHVRSGQLLGRFYQLGAGVEKDPEKAIPLFQTAADRGDAYAQHSLGKAYLEGNGVPEDDRRGIELLTRAAEAGHTFAMNQLGAEYLYGNRVEKDAERAHRYFRESYERGDVWGAMNLALLYRDGEGVEKDTDRAKELLTQAHEGMHPYAGRLLALMLVDEGSTDQRSLFQLFRESADRGDATGALYAADMMQRDRSLMAEEGEDIWLLAFALSRNAGAASESARDALTAMSGRLVNSEIQRTLLRMGSRDVQVDGVLGPRTRQAAEAILGRPAPQAPHELLSELVAQEWISSRPRLDML
ncbi:caspase family protein [Chelativorans salis]|uniref:Caspase family protein n=1 Tax=Chelativorans salis TaxID=2978478 RepID=A0ABT2LHT5_9HYPH|nr:caspase family protein [Chelativorans sp. EGI FJ00035]MCT7374125.1 caspase family protein [Chelativorans sp. EGI FJ00035]